MKKVKLYSKVKVENGKGRRSFTLVKPDEVNLPKGKISLDSPLGKALLNGKVNDIVEAKIPNGTTKYKIISVK